MAKALVTKTNSAGLALDLGATLPESCLTGERFNTFDAVCVALTKARLRSDAGIMADFGSAIATYGMGQSTFNDQCVGEVDLAMQESVVLSTLIPLSEADAQQGALPLPNSQVSSQFVAP